MPVLQVHQDSRSLISLIIEMWKSIGPVAEGLNNEDHSWSGGCITNISTESANNDDVLCKLEAAE